MISQPEAQQLVKEWTRLLKRQYGASRVIPFGSVIGQATWHEKSDIDLAVEGLPPQIFWRAWDELERLAPPGVVVDLKPFEQLYPDIRSRVLGETEMPTGKIAKLKIRLEDELRNLERVVANYLQRVPDVPEEIEVRGLASCVEDFYTGCERLFERVAVQLDNYLPQGKDWHLQLQRQMAKPFSGVRQAVISNQLAEQLDEYRVFGIVLDMSMVLN
jgi:predicted nucleotidyltransferase